MIQLLKHRRASSLLGLSFDGNRLEGVLLRRTNGAAEVQKTFSATLSLDLLKDDPELVGREIRNQLEGAGVRERRCAVCLPLEWALSLQSKLPDLPESDLESFLEIEAERGFPYGPDALFTSTSRFGVNEEQYATQVATPRDHVLRLEKVLRAARLTPVTFSLGIAALQPAGAESPDGVLALLIGEKSVGLQVSSGGGVAALRTLEAAFEAEGREKLLFADVIAREIRITLGQLPIGVRESVRRLRIFGPRDHAQRLLEEIRPRAQAMGIPVEVANVYAPGEVGLKLPASAGVSSPLSLAARHLAGQRADLEFLPPKVSAWQQVTERYSSKKLVWAGAAAGSVGLIVAAAFLFQQWQLSRLQSRWTAMRPQVEELEALQQQIKKFRPWFDDSCRSLSIMRKLTEAFPEDGVVSAKTFEIRDLSLVTCSGVARDQQGFLKMLDQLRATREIGNVTVDQVRGQRPMQFTFNFRWGEGGGNAN